MRILITVPNLSLPGGVASLYNILKLDKINGIEYFFISGPKPGGSIFRFIELCLMYIRFFSKCFSSYDIIQVNPSLNKKSFFRDGFLIIISKLFNKRALVYWHGWEVSFEERIVQNIWLRFYFNYTFLRADGHIVLGSVFKDKLKNLGINGQRVIIESNTADDYFINSDEEACLKSIEVSRLIKVLFIARIEIEKGIYIAIDAINLLKHQYDIELLVAGDGNELNNVKLYTESLGLTNVRFLGQIKGDSKHQIFLESDVLLFPTVHAEGMPISIIEAMMYGLPIISRRVGGIPDWVIERENGFLLDSKEPEDFARVINELLKEPSNFQRISQNNLIRSQTYFTPDKVKERLSTYYHNLITDKYEDK